MKMGHNFPAHAGFTGSANPSMDMRPKMPGYKHGGMDEKMEHKEHGDHPKNESHGHHDEHGFHIHKGHKKKGHKMHHEE